MSAVIETKPEVFNPVNYYDKRTINATSPRWVGCPLDLIPSDRKSEISWLKVGGEEIASPCLQRYGRNFIPRGRAAVLELGGEPIPMRHLGDLQAVAWQGISFSEEVAKNNFGFVPVFPGDGLKVLKKYTMNPFRRGIDEITSLANKPWEECHTDEGDGILDVIETAMFGDGIEPTLKGLESQIKSAVITDNRIDIGKYKSEWLAMCEDARNWGMRMIAVEHGLLKTGHVGEWQGGWSYSYSPVCEMLMDQLEVTRQDQPLHEMSKLIERMVPQAPPPEVSALTMELFERKMEERLAKARLEWEAERNGTPFVANPQDFNTEVFCCSHCGKECASKAGQLAHERFCKSE